MGLALALVLVLRATAEDDEPVPDRTSVPSRAPAIISAAVGFGALAVTFGMLVQRESTQEQIRRDEARGIAVFGLRRRLGEEDAVLAASVAVAVIGLAATLFLWWFTDPDA